MTNDIKKITQDEWNKTHKDYKSIIKGQKHIMVNDPKTKGSSLVPVEIIKESIKSQLKALKEQFADANEILMRAKELKKQGKDIKEIEIFVAGQLKDSDEIDSVMSNFESIKSKLNALKESPNFDSWFNTFLEEKNLQAQSWELKDKNGQNHIIDSEVVIQNIKNAPENEQAAIKNMLVNLDLKNANIMDYFKHLAQALINMRFNESIKSKLNALKENKSTWEGSFTIKWYKNDSGDRRPLTIDANDEKEYKLRLKQIKDDFMNKGEKGKLPYNITFDMNKKEAVASMQKKEDKDGKDCVKIINDLIKDGNLDAAQDAIANYNRIMDTDQRIEVRKSYDKALEKNKEVSDAEVNKNAKESFKSRLNELKEGAFPSRNFGGKSYKLVKEFEDKKDASKLALELEEKDDKCDTQVVKSGAKFAVYKFKEE